jgi:chemotaxis-related protein WspB
MLLLVFRSGDSLYAIDAKQVVEVVPRVNLRPVPHAPAFLPGLLSYRGRVVPVVDFGVLIGASLGRDALSTRAILAEFTGADGTARLVGLVAEDVSHVVNAEGRQIVAPAMSLDEAPYLGAVVQLDEGLVQLVEAGKLLSERMQVSLYGGQAEPSG